MLRSRRGPLFITVSSERLAVSSWQNFAFLLTAHRSLLLDSEEGLSVLDGLAVLDVNLDDFARSFGLNLVHQLHRFDNANDRVGLDFAADAHKTFGCRRGRAKEGADDGRGNNVQILIFRGGLFGMSSRMRRSSGYALARGARARFFRGRGSS